MSSMHRNCLCCGVPARSCFVKTSGHSHAPVRATAAPWIILGTQIPDKNNCSGRGTGCGWCLVSQARGETKTGGFGFLRLEEVSRAKILKTCCHALRAGNFVVLSSYLQHLTGCDRKASSLFY